MYRLPEHVGNWVIANIVADPNAAAEEFDSNVLRFSVVDKDAVLFLGRKDHRDVGFWFGLQRWHLNVRTVLGKADACQKFATLSWRDKRRLVNKKRVLINSVYVSFYLYNRLRICKCSQSILEAGSRCRFGSRAVGKGKSVGIKD